MILGLTRPAGASRSCQTLGVTNANQMSIVDALVSPGAAIGCVVGIGASAILHWLFPAEDLLAVQALLIVLFSIGGLVVEHAVTDRGPRK